MNRAARASTIAPHTDEVRSRWWDEASLGILTATLLSSLGSFALFYAGLAIGRAHGLLWILPVFLVPLIARRGDFEMPFDRGAVTSPCLRGS